MCCVYHCVCPVSVGFVLFSTAINLLACRRTDPPVHKIILLGLCGLLRMQLSETLPLRAANQGLFRPPFFGPQMPLLFKMKTKIHVIICVQLGKQSGGVFLQSPHLFKASLVFGAYIESEISLHVDLVMRPF